MEQSKEYRLDLDQKNRVMIPAKPRGSLGSELILCLAQNDEHGLYVYTPEAWQEIMEPIDSRSPTAQQRFMQMHAEVVDVDNQDRITIPNHFIDALHIEHSVTFWLVC